MNLLYRLAILPLILTAASMNGAGAVSLLNTGTTPLVTSGLTFTVTGCQVGVSNSGTTSPCVSGNNLQLIPVNAGRGTITVEVIGGGGSAALVETGTTASNGNSNLLVNLSVSLTPGFNPATYLATNAEFTTNGVEKYSTCGTCGSDGSSAQAVVSNGPGTLMANLLLQNGSTAQTTQTVNSATVNFSGTGANAFTIAETLNLHDNGGDAIGTLQFNYMTLTLHTVPEPASITMMLLGLGGLAMARRRRQAS